MVASRHCRDGHRTRCRTAPRTCDPASWIVRRVPTSSAVGDASRAARLDAERLPQNLKDRPSIGIPAVSTPTRSRALRRDAADVALVPSSPFLPASTASSTAGLAGLLHPAADPGVHRVAALDAACLRSSPRFPSDACPPEPFPPEKPCSRHREPLPPCRCRRPRRAVEAMLRAGIRHAASPFPDRGARCSPGLPRPGAPTGTITAAREGACPCRTSGRPSTRPHDHGDRVPPEGDTRCATRRVGRGWGRSSAEAARVAGRLRPSASDDRVSGHAPKRVHRHPDPTVPSAPSIAPAAPRWVRSARPPPKWPRHRLRRILPIPTRSRRTDPSAPRRSRRSAGP
jgi:hypothetical protein